MSSRYDPRAVLTDVIFFSFSAPAGAPPRLIDPIRLGRLCVQTVTHLLTRANSAKTLLPHPLLASLECSAVTHDISGRAVKTKDASLTHREQGRATTVG